MLTLIVLLPLLGFLLNGVLATQLGGNRVGKSFVTVVGCGLPILSFAAGGQGLLRSAGRRLRAAGRDRLPLGADRPQPTSRSPSTSTG